MMTDPFFLSIDSLHNVTSITQPAGKIVNRKTLVNTNFHHREEFQYIRINKEAELKRELKKLEMQLRKYPNRTDLKLAMMNIRNELKKLKKK